MIRKLLVALAGPAAVIAIAAAPAHAAAHSHPLHESRGPWAASTCNNHSGKYNTNGTTFYSAAIHSSSSGGTLCWQTFRGIAKCYVGHSTQEKVRRNGPWEDVNPTATWSRANCPNGDTLYKGGVQGSYVGTGNLSPVFWNWPPSSSTLARTDCTLNYEQKVNFTLSPVWGETRSKSSTTCSGQQRSVILVCLRGNCGGGFFHGGWILLSNHKLYSRATSGIAKAGLHRAWFEDRGGSGQDVQCQEYYPSIGSAFDCDPADQP